MEPLSERAVDFAIDVISSVRTGIPNPLNIPVFVGVCCDVRVRRLSLSQLICRGVVSFAPIRLLFVLFALLALT